MRGDMQVRYFIFEFRPSKTSVTNVRKYDKRRCFVDGVEGLLYAVMQFGDIFVMGLGDVITRG
jgi:hypothetical protein